MACLTKANSNNFLTWNKVNGSLTLAQLQALGSIGFCADILSAPSLSGEVLTSYSTKVSWNNVGGQTGYTLQRKTGAGAYSTLTTPDAGDTEYTDTTLAPETTYTYRIKAEGITNDSSYSNEVTLTTGELEAPSGLILSDIELESITLTWTSNSAGFEDGFKVERSLTGIGAWSEIGTTGSGVVTYDDDTPPLDHGTTYYYRVRAYVGASNSEYTDVENATTATMGAPSSFAVTSTIYNAVVATWVSNSGGEEDAFQLERSLTTGSGFAIIASLPTGTLTYTDRTADPLTTYYYRVRAWEEQGVSPYSSEDNLTTGTALLNLANPNGDQLTNPNGDKLVAIN